MRSLVVGSIGRHSSGWRNRQRGSLSGRWLSVGGLQSVHLDHVDRTYTWNRQRNGIIFRGAKLHFSKQPTGDDSGRTSFLCSLATCRLLRSARNHSTITLVACHRRFRQFFYSTTPVVLGVSSSIERVVEHNVWFAELRERNYWLFRCHQRFRSALGCFKCQRRSNSRYAVRRRLHCIVRIELGFFSGARWDRFLRTYNFWVKLPLERIFIRALDSSDQWSEWRRIVDCGIRGGSELR